MRHRPRPDECDPMSLDEIDMAALPADDDEELKLLNDPRLSHRDRVRLLREDTE